MTGSKSKTEKIAVASSESGKNLSPFYLGLIIFCSVSILACLVIFIRIILRSDIFLWDESHHAFYGLQLFNAIRAGDGDNFWFWTHRQAYWPFFHSWLLSLFFLLFGLSATTARAMNLLIFFITAILVYCTAVRLDEKAGWRIGLIAGLLVLASPLMVTYAGQNMLEGLGALEFILALFLYFVAREKRGWAWFAWPGIVIGLSIITKYNYAYLLIASFAIIGLADLPIFKNKITLLEWIYQYGMLAVPSIIISLLWFLSGDSNRKIQMLLWTKSEVAGKQSILQGFWNNFVFYPQVIIHDCCFSPWLGLLIFLSLLVPLSVFGFKKLRAPYLMVWVSTLLLTFTIGNKMGRLLHIVVPVIFIIAAAAAVYFFDLIRNRFKQNGAILSVLLLLLVPAALSFPRLLKTYNGDMTDMIMEKPEKLQDVINYFRDNIPRDRSVSTALSLGRMSPYDFYFYFNDWQAPFLGYNDSNNPNFSESDYFITIKIKDPNILPAEDDSVNRWNAWLDTAQQAGKIRLLKEREFTSLGLTAKIYMSTAINLLRIN
jgi:4-amino-4-deoxy-L-arabinose transferase-like glycosyltransferase